jgi:hypothetical protein
LILSKGKKIAKIDYKIVDTKTLELKRVAKACNIIDLSKSVEIDFEQINDKLREKQLFGGTFRERF